MQIAQANMAVMAGDSYRPGLEQIFLEHKDLVYRAAYRVTGNSSDAEDVLQTVFLRLVRQEKFPEISNLPGYLHRSAVNASRTCCAGKKKLFPWMKTRTRLKWCPQITDPIRLTSGTGCATLWRN